LPVAAQAPNGRTKPARQKINWDLEAVRSVLQDYQSGELTNRDLGTPHGLSPDSIASYLEWDRERVVRALDAMLQDDRLTPGR